MATGLKGPRTVSRAAILQRISIRRGCGCLVKRFDGRGGGCREPIRSRRASGDSYVGHETSQISLSTSHKLQSTSSSRTQFTQLLVRRNLETIEAHALAVQLSLKRSPMTSSPRRASLEILQVGPVGPLPSHTPFELCPMPCDEFRATR